jgi:hypothetical protein
MLETGTPALKAFLRPRLDAGALWFSLDEALMVARKERALQRRGKVGFQRRLRRTHGSPQPSSCPRAHWRSPAGGRAIRVGVSTLTSFAAIRL